MSNSGNRDAVWSIRNKTVTSIVWIEGEDGLLLNVETNRTFPPPAPERTRAVVVDVHGQTSEFYFH